MWKKDEINTVGPATPEPEDRALRVEPRPSSRSGGERASIGRSIVIRGEVSGEEDLLIQGRVDGSVNLPQQAVVVGSEGRVKAGITGRVVTVEGEVEGDLTAQEQVVLRSSARVRGDITAPRVVLEDGANFRGLVDMEVSRGKEDKGRDADTRSKAPSGKTAQPGEGEAQKAESPGKGAQADAPSPSGSVEGGKGSPPSAGKALS